MLGDLVVVGARCVRHDDALACGGVHVDVVGAAAGADNGAARFKDRQRLGVDDLAASEDPHEVGVARNPGQVAPGSTLLVDEVDAFRPKRLFHPAWDSVLACVWIEGYHGDFEIGLVSNVHQLASYVPASSWGW